MTDLFIGRALLERVLARTMKTGADFAEIFAESTRRNSLYMIDGRIESASDSTISGVGLRAFKGLRCVSASTSDLSEAGLMRAAAQVADIIGEGNEEIKIHLRERINADIHPVAVVPDSEYKSVKAEILKRGVSAASAYDKAIVQASGNLLDVDRHILIANSDGRSPPTGRYAPVLPSPPWRRKTATGNPALTVRADAWVWKCLTRSVPKNPARRRREAPP